MLKLTGKKFGLLTAIRPTDKRSGEHIIWECLCDCGNTHFVGASDLQNGHTKSCGCQTTAVDLTGKKFGILTAIRPTDKRGGGSIVWEVLCDCGNTHLVGANSLQRGKTKSCGCLSSAMEATAKKWLTEHGFRFDHNKKVFADLQWLRGRDRQWALRPDFVVYGPNGEVLAWIECNGIQHYQAIDFAGKGQAWAHQQYLETRVKDNIKNAYARKNHLPLYAIRYDENLEEALEELLG